MVRRRTPAGVENTEGEVDVTEIAKSVEEGVTRRTRTKKSEKRIIDPNDLMPSGATLLNCACSDNPFGAYELGRIVTVPGGSATGKTILMLTMLAEMSINPRFYDYKFVFDDAEESLAFDMNYLFGPKLAERLEPPGGYDDDGMPLNSNTIQDFKSNVLTTFNDNEKVIYLLDSLDTLTSTEEIEKEYKKAIRNAKSDEHLKEIKGSYKTEKAKGIGEALRMINQKVKHSESALFIVQQIRQKIGVTFGRKTTTSGGNAPFFYSHHQVWLHKTKTLKKTSGGIKRKIGSSVEAEVAKNKLTGKLREVNFNIFYDYGVDDIGSCIDFLVEAKYWPKRKQTIIADELGIEGTRDTVINTVEEENMEKELRETVGKAWNEIEEDVRLGRKPKYR